MVGLALFEGSQSNPGLPDTTTWTLLSASNLYLAPKQITSFDGTYYNVSWLAAHVYGTSQNDSGTYSFTHYSVGAEFTAFMVIYRGANATVGNYTAYGSNMSSDYNYIYTSPVSPPSETTLATLFEGDVGCDPPEASEPNYVFSSPHIGISDYDDGDYTLASAISLAGGRRGGKQRRFIYGAYSATVAVL